MKLELLQENLKTALAIAGRVAPSRATLPVLGNVLLKAVGSRLQVSACDLTTSITVLVSGKVEDEGAVTLPAKRVAEVVALMPQERMSIDVAYSTQTATLKGSKSKTSIKGIDAQEFPVIPTLDSAVAMFTLPASDLLKAFRAVSFAMSTDNSRPSLHALFIRLTAGCAKFAATDGFRLAEFSLPVQYHGDLKELLIDAVSVGHIERVLTELAKSASEVTLAVSKSNGQTIIGNEAMQVVAQLVDQKYVDYTHIIPRKFDTTATVVVTDLVLAIRQAATAVADGLGVDFVFERSEESGFGLYISGKSEDATADSSIEMVMDGPQTTTQINPDYILQTLGALSSVQAKLSLNGPRNPMMIKPVGADDALYVLMPIHKPKEK